jgi:density-regulated protein DRP1
MAENPQQNRGRHVVYCGICTLPPEYCEYGGTIKKCQEWLRSHHAELYEKIWSAEALAEAAADLSVEARERAEKDAQKKAAKAEAQEKKDAEKLASSHVTIKRIERNKRKFVTAVTGLEAFGLELKKVGWVSFLSPVTHGNLEKGDDILSFLSLLFHFLFFCSSFLPFSTLIFGFANILSPNLRFPKNSARSSLQALQSRKHQPASRKLSSRAMSATR